jgi:hypothetical protein
MRVSASRSKRAIPSTTLGQPASRIAPRTTDTGPADSGRVAAWHPRRQPTSASRSSGAHRSAHRRHSRTAPPEALLRQLDQIQPEPQRQPRHNTLHSQVLRPPQNPRVLHRARPRVKREPDRLGDHAIVVRPTCRIPIIEVADCAALYHHEVRFHVGYVATMR